MSNKKIFKILGIVFVVVILITSIGIGIHIATVNYNAVLETEYHKKINDDCELIIKDNKLYDTKNDKFIILDKRNDNVKQYVPHYLKKANDVYFVVYSNKNIKDDVIPLYSKDIFIYVINPVKDNIKRIEFDSYNSKYYISLSNSYPAGNSTLIAPLYDAKHIKIQIGLIIMSAFTDNNKYFCDYYVLNNVQNHDLLIIDSFIANHEYIFLKVKLDNDEPKYHFVKFEFYFHENGKGYSTDPLDSKYKKEKFINEGYYALFNDDIVYLNNNLEVVIFNTDKVIEKLDTKELFIDKYKNK